LVTVHKMMMFLNHRMSLHVVCFRWTNHVYLKKKKMDKPRVRIIINKILPKSQLFWR